MPSIACSGIENPNDLRLCEQIVGAIVGAENLISVVINNSNQGVKNSVANLVSGLSTQISLSHNATRNQVSTSERNVNNNVSNQAALTRGLIGNVQYNLQSQFASGLSSVSNFIEQVRTDIKSSIKQNAGASTETVNNVQNNVLAGLAQAALDITGRVNQGTEIVRVGLSALQGQVTDTIGNIETTIKTTIDDVASRIQTAFRDLFQPFIDWLLEQIALFLSWFQNTQTDVQNWFNDFLKQLAQFVQNFLDHPEQYTLDIGGFLGGTQDGQTVLRLVIALLLFAPNAFGIAGALYKPFIHQLEQNANVLTPTALLDPETVIRGLWRDTIDPLFAVEQLAKAGYSKNSITAIFETYKQVLGIGEIQQLYQRNFIDGNEALDRLSFLGYGDTDSRLIFELFNVQPPLVDVIRFAVREAFDPQIVQLYGTDENYPDLLTAEAAKRGLSETDAKYYWRSHWELPSISYGFEMYHRGLIDKNQLETLLRTLDVMPFWREKLIGMSFNLPARVDVRRLYAIGVWDRQQVYNAYIQSGYTAEVAEGLTKLTEIEYDPAQYLAEDSPRLLARTSIEKAVKRGIMTYEEGVTGLIQLKYSENDARLLLDLALFNSTVDDVQDLKDDFERRIRNIVIKLYTRRTISREDAIAQLGELAFEPTEAEQLLDSADIEFNLSVQDDILSTIQKMYIEFTIDENELTSVLSGFGYSNDEINRIYDFTQVYRQLRSRKPTLAQFTTFLKKGIINIYDYRKELQGLGYADRYIDMYLAQLALESPDLFVLEERAENA